MAASPGEDSDVEPLIAHLVRESKGEAPSLFRSTSAFKSIRPGRGGAKPGEMLDSRHRQSKPRPELVYLH